MFIMRLKLLCLADVNGASQLTKPGQAQEFALCVLSGVVNVLICERRAFRQRAGY